LKRSIEKCPGGLRYARIDGTPIVLASRKINDPIDRRKQAYDRRMRVNVIALR
jgi:hypothetical protein